MNPGGFRVSPLEVEAALSGLPGAEVWAVAEVEIKPGTRVIACFYTGREPVDPDVHSAFAASRLARYRQPRIWQHVPSLPRNANGKLNRRLLASLWNPK